MVKIAMNTTLHIAKAHILKHKSAAASLFAIIAIISFLLTAGLSVLLGAAADFRAGRDRLNGVHSALVLSRDLYNPSYEEIIKADARVSQHEIGEVLFVNGMTADYGGEVELLGGAMFFSLAGPAKISAPLIIEEDLSIPRENAIYLSAHGKGFYSVGDPFALSYRNKQYYFTVAGFFETCDFGNVTDLSLKFFVPEECYARLAKQFVRYAWIAVRFRDAGDSAKFNGGFAAKLDLELSSFAFECNADTLADSSVTPVSAFSSIVVVFSLLLAFISMLVIRFRVSNSIENATREIGVLKAEGYENRQIVRAYLAEYGIISGLASIAGIILAAPIFPAIRAAMFSLTGFTWTLGVNYAAGLAAAFAVTAMMQLMIRGSCAKIRLMSPVTALRGAFGAGAFRRNRFPLHRGGGGVNTRLGLKSMLAFIKTYAMIGLVMAGISLAVVFITVTYQNFVLDSSALAQMTGYEVTDVNLIAARRTDADALAASIGQMPHVRKTSMIDIVRFDVNDTIVDGRVSDDFGLMETMSAKSGRFPKYDNEVAFPRILAIRLGVKIGDSVKIKANGVSLDYIITGYFSAAGNGGRMAAITLDGYRRLDPNYRRSCVNVYLNPGVSFDEFSGVLKDSYGVLNVYRRDENENGRFAAAKARAEEKISNYLEHYKIDSVEYAVIYNGEIILSGSSGAYQIEKITDYRELLDASIGGLADAVALVTQVIAAVSILVISLILSMTVRSVVAKRRRDLGILKASGFTTVQLARQLAVSFMPLAAAGAVLGGVCGALLVNPVFEAMLANEGVMNASFSTDPLVIALVIALTLLAAFSVAHISAMRIKNITVYELLSE